MKTRILAAAIAAVASGLFFSGAANADAFQAGSIVVVQVGNGNAALGAVSTATYLEEFAPDGSPIQTIALPTAASGANMPFTLTGNGTTEGYISLSTNGQYLTMGGYGVAPGVATPSTPAGGRVVARIDMNGNIDTTTVLGDNSSNNTGIIRSVASVDGTNFWIGGSALGVRYTTLGTTTKSTRVNTGTPTNIREVNIFNGQLYASSANGTYQGVGTIGTGLPTDTTNTGTLLNGFPTATGPSPNDFVVANTGTVYVADDRTPANGGGLQKWTFNAGTSTWSIAYTLSVGLTGGSGALRGLTAASDGNGNEVFYATTALNTVVKITDYVPSTTLPANELFKTIVAAPTNAAFRDVTLLSTTISILPGDTNYDGKINADDFALIDRGFAKQPASMAWSDGNFNGDQVIDSQDYLIIDTAYGQQVGLSPAFLAGREAEFGDAYVSSLIAAVPDPARFGLIISAVLPLLRSGRRRSIA
jgi:hypothetical protein